MPQPRTTGTPPGVGQSAPQLRYVKPDRSNAELAVLKGEVVILCTFPSVDTSTCAAETRAFNVHASGLGAHVLIVSMDLPPALKRFCEAEGITKVQTGSDFRFRDGADRWGLALIEGNLTGTLARCVWVIDKEGVIRYYQQPDLLGLEPDYAPILAAAGELL